MIVSGVTYNTPLNTIWGPHRSSNEPFLCINNLSALSIRVRQALFYGKLIAKNKGQNWGIS